MCLSVDQGIQLNSQITVFMEKLMPLHNAHSYSVIVMDEYIANGGNVENALVVI